MLRLDTRGRSCPEPVLMVKDQIKNGPANIEVILDSQVALENVTRFAQSQGYKVDSKESGEDFILSLSK